MRRHALSRKICPVYCKNQRDFEFMLKEMDPRNKQTSNVNEERGNAGNPGNLNTVYAQRFHQAIGNPTAD
jgi:hypothetical protein